MSRDHKKNRKQTTENIDALYRAVQQWVESRGGKLAVIGGVEIQQWPDDLPFTFRVAIRCTGKQPLVQS